MSGPADRVVTSLTASGQTVAVAESLTGGLLGAALTDVAGASAVFPGGLTAYATPIKAELLEVPAELLAEAGAVDARVAIGMAEGARRLFAADWGLATTGVAGPTPQDGNPVGTVFVACAGPDGSFVERLELAGDRSVIRHDTVIAALELLLTHLGRQ